MGTPYLPLVPEHLLLYGGYEIQKPNAVVGLALGHQSPVTEGCEFSILVPFLNSFPRSEIWKESHGFL